MRKDTPRHVIPILKRRRFVQISYVYRPKIFTVKSESDVINITDAEEGVRGYLLTDYDTKVAGLMISFDGAHSLVRRPIKAAGQHYRPSA